ncbi:HNH endonuclease [Enterococcus alcedinis]
MFKGYIMNDKTKFFIIDTHGGKDIESIFDDKDFVRYAWELSRFGKVSEGDLFIYRRPMKDSEFREFYFFGAGVFGAVDLINDEKNKPVVSYIREFVKFDKLILASNNDLLQYKWKFKERTKNNWEHFFNQYGMTEIKKEDFMFLTDIGVATDLPIKDTKYYALEKEEIIDELQSVYIDKEGKKKLIFGYKYERNPRLRKEALKIHGFECKACNFNFESMYGEIGKEFIEVHHIKPLSEIGRETVINPKYDLIPLCPNCHRMIHRKRNNMMSVDELKEIVKK